MLTSTSGTSGLHYSAFDSAYGSQGSCPFFSTYASNPPKESGISQSTGSMETLFSVLGLLMSILIIVFIYDRLLVRDHIVLHLDIMDSTVAEEAKVRPDPMGSESPYMVDFMMK